MEFSRLEEIYTDVLIIGGGPGGLWTACQFKENMPEKDVLIVDKGPKDWGGMMSLSGGDFDAVMPGENVDDWVKDLVYYWDGLCDQNMMKKLLSGIYDRFMDYQKMGCEYLTEHGVPQRHLEHYKLYVTKEKGYGGERMAQLLVKRVKEKNVRSMGRVLMTDLIKKEGQVVGAVGFESINGILYVFHAKAVVIACGMSGWKASYLKNTSAGAWVEMVLKAGVNVTNFEFGRVWNTPKEFSWEGQTTLLPLGAKYVNKDGESFMDRYSPKFGNDTDPHYLTLGMALEARAGKAPIYFDVSELDNSKIDIIKPKHGWQVLNYHKMQDLGIEFFKDKLEWNPQLMCCFGGMEVDLEHRTNVKGLYATGTCTSLDPGVYIGGFGLSTAAQGGYITGTTIANDFKEEEPVLTFDMTEAMPYVEVLKQRARKQGKTPKQVLRKIQEIVFPAEVCIIKSEKSLKKALSDLYVLREDMEQMCAKDPHDLLKLMEVRGIYRVTELHILASLLRTESRGGHYREDYPTYNDEEWLAWLMLREEDGKIISYKKKVPLEQYPFPVEKHYFDNFDFKTKGET